MRVFFLLNFGGGKRKKKKKMPPPPLVVHFFLLFSTGVFRLPAWSGTGFSSTRAGFMVHALTEEDPRSGVGEGEEEEVRDWCDESDAFKNGDYRTASIPLFCTGLTILEIIGDTGAIAMAKAIKDHPTLTMLGLSNGKIGDDGAVALSETIGSTKIEELFLNNNLIGDTGAAALAQGIASSADLVNLDMYNNKVGDAGAAAFAEMLKTKTMQLQLEHNRIGEVGSAALAEALEVNTELKDRELVLLADLDGVSGIDANNPDSLSNSILNPSKDSDHDSTKSNAVSASDSAAATSADPPDSASSGSAKTLNRKMAEGKERALANPCGTHAGCEESLGDYIIARYLQVVEIDFLRLHELGISSAMDMAVLAFEDKFNSDASLFMNAALESVMLPFKPIQRKKMLHLLPARAAELLPSFVEGADSKDAADNLATVSLEEWAAQKHIAPPAAVIKQLRSLGVANVADLTKLSKTNLGTIKAKLKLVEAWWFQNGIDTTLSVFGRQQQQQQQQQHNPLDADYLNKASLEEWGSRMNIASVALEEIKAAGAEKTADLLFVDDDVLQQIYAGLSPPEVKALEVAMGSTRRTLKEAMKDEHAKKSKSRHEEL